MIRNLQISKETQDRVKLAKKYIEDKYQLLIEEENRNHQKWGKVIDQISKNKLNQGQKHLLVTKIIQQQSINKRIHRQKDYLDNYILYNIIGRGAFGQVRLAKNKHTSQVIAIKRLEKKKITQKKQIYNAYLQRDFMIKNKSQFLVQLKSTFQDKNYLYLVMEYVSGGDLLHLLIEKDILTENETRFYIAQMIIAIEEIHKLNYIHRDIKPDNILLDKRGHIKISDFGLSKYLQSYDHLNKNPLTKLTQLKRHMALKQRQKCFSKVGTPDYISPQVLTQSSYDFSVDIWGVGVVMFQCLFGYPPFSHDDSKEVCNRVVNWLQYLQFPEDIRVSTQAKMLILGMMNNKQQRLTIKQIKSHPFFRGINWSNLRSQQAPIIPIIKNQLDTTNFDKFQQNDNWLENNLKITLNLHRVRSSSLELDKYKFAGFDYRKNQGENNILDIVQKQMMMLTRDKSYQKSYQKSFQSRKSTKRIRTQLSAQRRQKGKTLIKQQKNRGSYAIGKQNCQKSIVNFSGKKSNNNLRVMKKKILKGI